jgi:hypothetical protein
MITVNTVCIAAAQQVAGILGQARRVRNVRTAAA